MSDYCKETQCTTCAHIKICSVKEKFLSAQKSIDSASISWECKDGKVAIQKICDIDFIRPITLQCDHYLPINNTFPK